MPVLKGRVNDYANMLSPATVTSLEARLAEFEKSDSTQIVVLTIPSLQGEVLEEFSIRVAEKWKIGQKKLDNGVILLIAKEDRKLRIEVGYGLEGKLTDLRAGRIIDNIIKPSFKAGNYDKGVADGVDAIMQTVKGEYSAVDAPAPEKKDTDAFSLITPVIIRLFLYRHHRQDKKGAGRDRRRGDHTGRGQHPLRLQALHAPSYPRRLSPWT